MEILGIGPLELFFILIIALIVLGPKDMVKTGRTIGRFLRSLATSPTWRAVSRTSTELRNLPNKLIRDAGLEDELRDIGKIANQPELSGLGSDLDRWQKDISSWTTPPKGGKESPQVSLTENSPPESLNPTQSEDQSTQEPD